MPDHNSPVDSRTEMLGKITVKQRADFTDLSVCVDFDYRIGLR